MRINKVKKILGGLAFSLVASGGFASCSSDLNEPSLNNPAASVLVNTPKVTAYSGGHFWSLNTNSGSVATRSGEDVVTFKAAEAVIDREKHQKLIEDFLPEQNVNLGAGVKDDFLYYAEKSDITFEIFPLVTHTSYNPNYLGVFYYDNSGQRHEVLVWEAMNPYDLTRTDYSVYPAVTYSKGVHVTIKKGYKFGFFWGGRYYPVDGNGWNDAETKFYSISELNEDSYVFENGNVNKSRTSRVHAITFDIEGKTYLGLEDWADFDFQDLVFGSDIHIPTVDDTDKLPDIDEEEKPEIPDVVEPGDEGNEDNEDSIGETVKKGFDEVEINLALDNKNNEYLESHLSLHVRHATNVEVFIPVPAKYYCEADDMDIVLNKFDEVMHHGGPHKTEFLIGDNMVTLNVEFKIDGIRIYTTGINSDVIAYCREHFEDGITFEVWNYFNDPDKVGTLPISMEELKTYLDRSTVRFIDDIPATYVNAFGVENGKYGENGSLDGKDFHVVPESQLNSFDVPKEGTHLNGSDKNDIYNKF